MFGQVMQWGREKLGNVVEYGREKLHQAADAACRAAKSGTAKVLAALGLIDLFNQAAQAATPLTPLAAPDGLAAADLQSVMVTALTPFWGAILGISVLSFAIGTFIMVFKRRTTGALKR